MIVISTLQKTCFRWFEAIRFAAAMWTPNAISESNRWFSPIHILYHDIEVGVFHSFISKTRFEKKRFSIFQILLVSKHECASAYVYHFECIKIRWWAFEFRRNLFLINVLSVEHKSTVFNKIHYWGLILEFIWTIWLPLRLWTTIFAVTRHFWKRLLEATIVLTINRMSRFQSTEKFCVPLFFTNRILRCELSLSYEKRYHICRHCGIYWFFHCCTNKMGIK